MRSTKIITAFVTNNDKVLILKRSHKVKSMKGLWGGVSGIIEEGEKPLERAKIEIYEETGASIESLRLLKSGREMAVSSPQYPDHQWIIFPFLFETHRTEIMLNWENSSYRWIDAKEIHEYKTVPNLADVLFNLL
jgi:8-oxo-dGTP pyrophosphatase MutT (NUDIX family)